MIVVNRDTEIRTIQTPQFVFTGRDEDVQDLTMILNIVTGISEWGKAGVKFLPMEINLLKRLLIEKSNELIQILEFADRSNKDVQPK
jgi:hypothetical protein